MGSDYQIRVLCEKMAQEKDALSTNFAFLAHGVETELRMKLLSRTFSNSAPHTPVSSCASIRAAGGADTLMRFSSNLSQQECVCARVLRARSCARL